MGGHAFASGSRPLCTPRMSRHVYHRVRDRCHAVLRELFLCVATPIDGAGKQDYGDVDILVALEKRLVLPKNPQNQRARPSRDVLTAIQIALGGEAIIINNGDASANIALPWPEDLRDSAPPDPVASAFFIQVDVRVCEDVQDLQWRLFIHAHGDIWNLLGSTIRPFGLTVDDQAMWLRIPEIEAVNRKREQRYSSRMIPPKSYASSA